MFPSLTTIVWCCVAIFPFGSQLYIVIDKKTDFISLPRILYEMIELGECDYQLAVAKSLDESNVIG